MAAKLISINESVCLRRCVKHVCYYQKARRNTKIPSATVTCKKGAQRKTASEPKTVDGAFVKLYVAVIGFTPVIDAQLKEHDPLHHCALSLDPTRTGRRLMNPTTVCAHFFPSYPKSRFALQTMDRKSVRTIAALIPVHRKLLTCVSRNMPHSCRPYTRISTVARSPLPCMSITPGVR